MKLNTLLLLQFVVCSVASTFHITDVRIQNTALNPALGRGYSQATGDLHATCLEVGELTKPTYNYKYYFTEVKNEAGVQSSISGDLSASFSFGWVKAQLKASFSSTTSSKSKLRHIFATMRTDRYYSSVDETSANLSSDAVELLDRNDYISFFQACGPSFIRGIQRGAEVTVMFTYTAAENENEFTASFRAKLKGIFSGAIEAGVKVERETYSQYSSMTITIVGYGLGLNKDGADSMVAQSFEDFEKVMKYAFKSMQDENVGLVHGLELVPWISNINFQVKADLVKSQGELEDFDVPPSMRKLNMNLNAEFIAQLSATLRSKVNNLEKNMKCLQSVWAIPRHKDSFWLKNHRITSLDSDTTQRVGDLRNVLDIKAVEAQAVALEEYSANYFAPCIAALEESKLVEVPWLGVDACVDFKCNLPGMRWDENGCSWRPNGATNQLIPYVALISEYVDQYCMPTLGDDSGDSSNWMQPAPECQEQELRQMEEEMEKKPANEERLVIGLNRLRRSLTGISEATGGNPALNPFEEVHHRRLDFQDETPVGEEVFCRQTGRAFKPKPPIEVSDRTEAA